MRRRSAPLKPHQAQRLDALGATMTRNTTPSNSDTIRAADVIRALQDAVATAFATKDELHALDKLATDAAAAELRAHAHSQFIRIKTGERSSMKILNTRERISEMIATVRRSPALFGGGPVEKITRATKPAQWKARSVSMVWELIQDGDHAAALAMAETMGALFYYMNGRAGMTWAPMPVDGMPEGFVSARRWDGAYTVFHTVSMLAMNGAGLARSRAKAEEIARSIWNSKHETQQAYALQASHNCPMDQSEARAQWLAQCGIESEASEAGAHAEASEAGAHAEAARQVSELIAIASAAAAIEHASEAAPMATPEDCEAGRELATVDACEAGAMATSCEAGNASASAPGMPQHGHASATSATSARQAPAPAGDPLAAATMRAAAALRRQSAAMAPDNARAQSIEAGAAGDFSYLGAIRGYLERIAEMGRGIAQSEARRALEELRQDLASVSTEASASTEAGTPAPTGDDTPSTMPAAGLGYASHAPDDGEQIPPVPSTADNMPRAVPAADAAADVAPVDADTLPGEPIPAGAVCNLRRQAQAITPKAHAWRAWFYLDDAGRPCCEFESPDGARQAWRYTSGAERMQALQILAQRANDYAAGYDDDGEDDDTSEADDENGRERRLNSFDAMTATAADVQAMGAEYVAMLADDLEDINAHGEHLILLCLAAGREDLAERARDNLREHLRLGYLSPELSEARHQISTELHQGDTPDPTNPAADTPSDAQDAPQGYEPAAPDVHQQTAPVPSAADDMPRAVAADSGAGDAPSVADLIALLHSRGFHGVESRRRPGVVVLARKGNDYALTYSNTTQGYKTINKLSAAGIAATLRGHVIMITGELPPGEQATQGPARSIVFKDDGQHAPEHHTDPAGRWEAWTQEHVGGFVHLVFYVADAWRPTHYYHYKGMDKAREALQRFARDAEAIAQQRADRKARQRAALDKPHGLAVGDVVRSSWGYDQTNVDYFEVTAVIGKRTVEVRKLAEHIEHTGSMNGNSAPIPGQYVGEPMRRQVDSQGAVNILHETFGRAYKMEPVATVAGVRCFGASSWSSYH